MIKIYFYKLIISFIAVINRHITISKFVKTLTYSFYRFYHEGILKWEEFVPPKGYKGCLPPIHLNSIKNLLIESKIDFDVIELDIDYFLPQYKYESRKELLDVIAKNDTSIASIKKTYMCRNKGMSRCNEIIELYNNIKKNGYKKLNKNDIRFEKEFPTCYLHMPEVGIRIDGTNRAAVMKYIGEKKISVIRIKCEELFRILLPGDGRSNIENMRMEIIRHWYKKYKDSFEKKISISKNIFSANWYQDVELAPGVYTHAKKVQQTDTWLKNVPHLNGRKVIDLGCCNGNYSFISIDKGASKVLGCDISKFDIERAKFAQQLKLIDNKLYENIEFKNIDMLKHLSIIKNYDTFNAPNVFYLLGPKVHDLMKAIQKSNIDLLILQGQLKRKDRIGEYNAPGVRGYEKTDKTWGNVLGTIEGLTNIAGMYGFKIENIIDSQNWPLIIAKR
jgi:hypothetical protein